MNRIAGHIGLLVVCLLASSSLAVADHVDGMTLSVSLAAAPGSVSLDWTGGQPTFRVYRSTNKMVVVDPGNLIGTSDVRTFGDAPPVGEIFFYEIASPCVYNPPEVCNGLDDDCDGTVDGPGSEASCNFPNATAACSGGTCTLLSCNPGYSMCGGASCTVSLLTDPQNCGACGKTCASGSCTGGACDVPVCTAGQRIWSTSFGGSDTGEPVLSPDGATVYFMNDSTLIAMRERAEPGCSIGDCAAGGFKWTRTFGGNFVAAPLALPDAVFASSTDGSLYKITVDGVVTSVSLQRTGCGSDALSASPVVQRYADSDSTFRTMADNAGRTGDDLVFVATSYPPSPVCGDGQNRVYALWKSDLTVRWIYNRTGSLILARGSGCTVDTPTDTVICGFDTTTGSSPNTLLALRTTTSLATGSTRWAVNTIAGVIGSPVIAALPGSESRVYVATADAYLRAFALTNGSVSWTGGSPVIVGGALFEPVFSVDRLYVLTLDGAFRSYVDNGTSGAEDGSPLWADPTFSVKFVTRPLFEPSSGGVPSRAWMGRSDGKVQQISASRTLEQAVLVDPPLGGTRVSGIVFESEPGVCTLDERLVSTVAGHATEFAVPLLTHSEGG